jgi:HAD superfamily hydrolase (TIGR01549 family)
MNVAAVLFDLDGTIVEFRLRASEAKQSVIDMFRAGGLMLHGVTSSSPLQAIIDRAAAELGLRGGDSYGEAWARAMSIMEGYEEEALKEAEPIKGMTELILRLKALNLKVGVVTNNSRKSTMAWLAGLGLLGVLDVVVTRDEVRRLKPSPEPLMYAIRGLGCDFGEAVFVGDSLFDYEAAKASGIRFVAFLGGAHSGLLREIPQVEHKAGDSSELFRIITGLAGRPPRPPGE